MPLSRRDFLKVAWIPFAVAACGPAVEALSTATSQPDATGLPTQRPDNTNAPDPTTGPDVIPTPLKPGYGGPDDERDKFMNETVEGRAQAAWLTSWLGYWSTAKGDQRAVAPVDLGSDTARLYIKKIPGSNTLVFESPDYPGVVIVPPVWAHEGMLLPEDGQLDTQPNHEIPAGSNILTLSTTSGPELVPFGIPEGSVLVPRNGNYYMVDKNDGSRAVGMVNFKTGQWERVDFSGFRVCTERSQATSCPVVWDNLDEFANFARFVDSTTFPPDVKIPPGVTVQGPPGDQYQKFLFWQDVDGSDEALTAFYRANPDKMNQKTMLYGGMDRGGWTSSIRMVKYLNPSGRVSYLTFFGQIDGSEKDNVSAWPVATMIADPFNSPEVVALLQQWADTDECPVGLNGKWLQEYSEPGH